MSKLARFKKLLLKENFKRSQNTITKHITNLGKPIQHQAGEDRISYGGSGGGFFKPRRDRKGRIAGSGRR